jgi:hypothetical protein
MIYDIRPVEPNWVTNWGVDSCWKLEIARTKSKQIFNSALAVGTPLYPRREWRSFHLFERFLMLERLVVVVTQCIYGIQPTFFVLADAGAASMWGPPTADRRPEGGF